MGQRSRVVVGSIVGAVAVHLAMLACSGDGGSPPGQLDASAVDGGHQARADAGDILDAITARDLGGALDAVADVVRDVVGKAVDAETRDAHAGGDAGVSACNCVDPPTFTFSGGAVTRQGVTNPPLDDFSTATASVQVSRAEAGGLRASASFRVAFYLSDGGSVNAACSVEVGADGALITRTDNGTSYDVYCTAVSYGNVRENVGGSSRDLRLTGARVTEFRGDRFTVTTPALSVDLLRAGNPQMPAGTAAVAPITVRAVVPGSQWLSIPRAYQR